MPLLFVLAWVGCRVPREAGATRLVRAIALVMLVAGSFVVPADPIERRRMIEARPEVELLGVCDDLRSVADGGTTTFTLGLESTPNFRMRDEIWALGCGAISPMLTRAGWIPRCEPNHGESVRRTARPARWSFTWFASATSTTDGA